MNADTLDNIANTLRNIDEALLGLKLQGEAHVYHYDAVIGEKALGRISFNDEAESTFVPVAS